MLPLLSVAQTAPPTGWERNAAIHADATAIVAWATGCTVERGPMRIDMPEDGLASYGADSDALGKADGLLVVSLGDGGNATLTFDSPIYNGPGPDFAVFENAFRWNVDTTRYFLELAFVEVSSDGENYVRFPAVSHFQTETQCGSYECTDPRLFHNLAGNCEALYGTPFDLDELPDDALLDKNRITHVRIVDVVGNIDPDYATYDCEGHAVNDPWPTPFPSSGFDLDAVGVLYDLAHYDTPEIADVTPRFYPNPVGGTLFVGGDMETVCIYSLTGQLLLESSYDAIDVTSLAPGLYIVCVRHQGNQIIKKIIKQ